MPTSTSGPFTHGHPSAVRSRNRAILAVVGVVGGGWLFFRALGPRQNGSIVTDQERKIMRGGDGDGTQAGPKTPRAPEKSLKSP